MKEIYVFGHRNPDTDSVCSSIALSYLKNALGLNTIPKVLGEINKESKFVLDYFNVKKPEFLVDVKVKIKNLHYEKKLYVNVNESIDNTFIKMAEHLVTSLAVVDDNKKIVGFITLKDIAKFLVSNKTRNVVTSYDHMLDAISGKVIVRCDENIEGDALIVALKSDMFINGFKLSNKDILIVGNRPTILEPAIENKVKLIILSCNSEIDEDLVNKAIKNGVNIIKSSYDSYDIATRFSLANYIYTLIDNTNPKTVNESDFLFEFKESIKNLSHSNYPVVNKRGECTGLVRISNSSNYDKQQVILVDHNTFSQSAVGIEEAEILEIIDHHNLGELITSLPINFRSMPVGCTSTIIYKMFKENKVDIPKEIAGIMLSAIISDTLLLTSPTTTIDDSSTAEKLALIAGVDIQSYGMELLKAGSSLTGLTTKELIYYDFKNFSINDKELGLSQLITMNIEEIFPLKDEIIEKIEEKILDGYDLFAVFVTDVVKNGSYVFYSNKNEEVIKLAFNLDEIYQGAFIPNVVSRKKQILPNILDIIN